ncbi:MAG: VWA domain-containing protein [Syntrophomonadaceae bacterium]|nr:VWA domain-containing protein [Syntrophomonadaceae bacterium]
MTFFNSLLQFFEELRHEGVQVTPSQAMDCCQALLYVNWLKKEQFYTALLTTLVKEHSYQAIFDEVYSRYFEFDFSMSNPKPKEQLHQLIKTVNTAEDPVGGENQLPVGLPQNRGSSSQPSRGRKNPLEQEFSEANLEDIRRMEALFPLIARRLAAKMIKKRKRNDRSNINYRGTIRRSMATGGIPVDIITSKKVRERPVILILCDVSSSVMNFSNFALALLAALENFFRQIRTFAFIDEIDEITHLLQKGNPLNLRSHIFKNAKVVGVSGYSDYGFVFRTFLDRYPGCLSHKTTVLIFGDARNNWFADESWVLKKIKGQVRRIYWFNPEPKEIWGSGDSRMYEYIKYCDKSFACPNLLELEKAIGQL